MVHPNGTVAQQIASEDRALAVAPGSIDALCALAGRLLAAGRLDDAIGSYRQILAMHPHHAVAGNGLGNALQRSDRFEDAIAAYRAALISRPDSVAIRANLGRALESAGRPREAIEELGKALERAPGSAEIHVCIARVLENIPFLDDARAYYEKALALDPNYADAHVGLGTALIDLGMPDQAWEHLRKGYAGRVLTTRPAVQNEHPIRVLKLVSAAGGIVPLNAILTPSLFEVTNLAVEFADGLPALDGFDLIVNAIGDADRCPQSLHAACALLKGVTTPVINPPARVVETSREAVSALLASIAGARVPRVRTLQRSLFETGQAAAALAEDGWRCPLLLRALGHHAGHHFVRVDRFDQIDGAALSLPGDQIAAIEWLETRGPDGMFRKYRVMFLGGEIHPLHLAIAKQWKVHYFSASMADDENYRAEELAFLSNLPTVVGAKGMAALRDIQQALRLDYAGLDFSLGESGEILVFEANATMRITQVSPNPVWDYRRPFMERAFAAARRAFTPRDANERQRDAGG
jgi:Tfp pilus assembly protein PilF